MDLLGNVFLLDRKPDTNPERAALTEAALFAIEDSIIVIDFEGFVVLMNRPVPNIAIEQNAPFEWSVPPDLREELRVIIADVAETGVTQDLTVSLNDANGVATEFSARMSRAIVNDEPGVVVQVRL